jgi:hypothetical protein
MAFQITDLIPITIKHIQKKDNFDFDFFYDSIKCIDLSDDNFNEPIDQVIWPKSLTTLIFSVNFNKPINKVKWPESLTTLTFGDNFNQPVEYVRWPDSLVTLNFGGDFNQPLDNVKWPKSLKKLYIDEEYDYPLDFLPETLEILEIDIENYSEVLCESLQNLPPKTELIIR